MTPRRNQRKPDGSGGARQIAEALVLPAQPIGSLDVMATPRSRDDNHHRWSRGAATDLDIRRRAVNGWFGLAFPGHTKVGRLRYAVTDVA